MFKPTRTGLDKDFTSFALSLLVLLWALFTYLVFRSENTLVCILAKNFVSEYYFKVCRFWISEKISPHELVVFSMPGALWMFATCLISRKYHIMVKKLKIRLDLIPIFVIVYFEIMQKLGFLKGYFDWNDLVFALFFYVVYVFGFREAKTKNLKDNFKIGGSSIIPIYSMVYLAHLC
ncbi:MAG: hypothetical protein SNJ77_02335 [Cytophagales bacterium]